VVIFFPTTSSSSSNKNFESVLPLVSTAYALMTINYCDNSTLNQVVENKTS
jgi:hypothetical protein